VDAIHLIINQLRIRAHGAAGLQRLIISPAAIRLLLQEWSIAEEAGVRFHSEGVVVEGVEFRLRGDVRPEIGAALKWRRAVSTMAADLRPASAC
jgi:hypothetical protein